MSASDLTPEKETCFIYDLSPETERELLHRASRKNRDVSTEAAEIIQEHVEENSGSI